MTIDQRPLAILAIPARDAGLAPSSPPPKVIATAQVAASCSPCRSQRGVVIYDPADAAVRATGHNGPPDPFRCPGRDLCRGVCGKLAVHAEVRALRAAIGRGQDLELVHVELTPSGTVAACDGPSCWQCSREIVDVGFIAGVWLYEISPTGTAWRRYGAAEFHRATLARCALPSPRTTR